jgi:S1-C subfamily serine protease
MFRTQSARVVTLAAVAALALPATRAVAGEADAPAIYRQTLRSTVLIATDNARGSGWVVDAERRLIVTNHHVIASARRVEVVFPMFRDGELVTGYSEYVSTNAGVPAKVLLSDPAKDLAVLQAARLPDDVVPMKLAARSPSPGERIHALGSPGVSGALWVYSAGYVRAVYRERTNLQGDQRLDAWVVETTLPTNPGDSGGPQVNDRGELVAVTSHHDGRGRLVTGGIDGREVKAVLKATVDGERGVRGVRGKKSPGSDDEEVRLAPPKGPAGKKLQPINDK